VRCGQARRRSITRPDSPGDGEAVEVDRVVSPAGTFALSGHVLTGAALLGGRQVEIRIEPSVLLLFDLDTRELLRTRPNPLTEKQVLRLRGLRPAGPPPRPSLGPVTVQRLADRTGLISVAKQRIGLGRAFARQTVTPTCRRPPSPSSSATETPTSSAGPPLWPSSICNRSGHAAAGSQGCRSASMVSDVKKLMPCLAALAR
jgi:hypothetical protein